MPRLLAQCTRNITPSATPAHATMNPSKTRMLQGVWTEVRQQPQSRHTAARMLFLQPHQPAGVWLSDTALLIARYSQHYRLLSLHTSRHHCHNHSASSCCPSDSWLANNQQTTQQACLQQLEQHKHPNTALPLTLTSSTLGKAIHRHQCHRMKSMSTSAAHLCMLRDCILQLLPRTPQGVPSCQRHSHIHLARQNSHHPTQSSALSLSPSKERPKTCKVWNPTSCHTTLPARTPQQHSELHSYAAETPVAGWSATQLPSCCLQLTNCALRCDVAPAKLHRCCCTAATLHHGVLACPLACCVLVPRPV